MSSTATLTMVDGVRVVVPDSLDLITPYVLREQEDWFEDELRFLRRLLQPGQTVIDIGANYGVYALSIARVVGPTGSVLAFEPASETARLLESSIAANNYPHVIVKRSAVSAVRGTARLAVGPHAELNALVRDGVAAGDAETVPVVTLDDCLSEQRWAHVDFVKIDAEGEENNILKGGERFFSQLSPLVQYEIKAGSDLHLELFDSFRARGYASYRLVPGLDLLVPFDPAAQPDGYLLNLFCCKPNQAARLAAAGRLLTGAERVETRPADWQRAMAGLPYAKRLHERWDETLAAGRSKAVEEALSLYWGSRDAASSPAERFAALNASVERLTSLCQREPSHLRLASLARVAREHGSRSLAVAAMSHLSEAIQRTGKVGTAEPFLAPGERFDGITPGDSIADWVFAALIEELERLSTFSSFYSGVSALPRLKAIRDLGFGAPEMQRRLALVQQRYGLRAE